MKAPFPYFGGKSAVAHTVWDALGNPAHYIEPFFGSGAVLLNRKKYADSIETICDKDGFVANVWRSLKFSPDKTAEWCDWPVNHADLIARKAAIIRNEDRLLENLCADDEWHDPKIAGYWIWAASCWIGSGLTCPNQIPHIGETGKGVHAKSVQGKIPHLTHAGKGVHARGKNQNIYQWFDQLSERMRFVRVVCGDWSRVCGGNWQTNNGVCGMFFDPPYSDKDRSDCYHKEDYSVAKDVEDWCLARGDNPEMRIVVAGYDSEYKKLIDAGWSVVNWKTSGGYGNTAGDKQTRGKDNAKREILVISPHCVTSQRSLF